MLPFFFSFWGRLDSRTLLVGSCSLGDGYHLGEHGEWEKKANFELTTRVPLMISAPHLPGSHGRSTASLVDLVDLYPTLADLAGLPSPLATEPWLANDSVSQVSLFGNFDDGGGEKAVGVAPRTRSFSQYPRCDEAGPTMTHTVEHGSCNVVDKHLFKYMGYTVRTDVSRYTAWMAWNGTTTTVDWAAVPYAEELYDHTGDDGTDFDGWENDNLVAAPRPARSPVVNAARDALHAALVKRFRFIPPRNPPPCATLIDRRSLNKGGGWTNIKT